MRSAASSDPDRQRPRAQQGLADDPPGCNNTQNTAADRTSRMHLKTLLGDYPVTSALKTREVASDSVACEFAHFHPTNAVFKPMVREGRFDVSEMAIVT